MPPKPQTVVFVEVAAGMGGVEYSTLYLAQQLDRLRWQPVIICPEQGALVDACQQAGLEVHVLPRPALQSTSLRLGKDWRIPNPLAWLWNLYVIGRAATDLAQFLAERQPALMVTKGLLAHFYGGLAARRLQVPCLWHVQDFISERFGGLYRRLFGLISRWLPTHIVVDGQPIVRQFPEAIRNKVTVVYNGVDTTQFRPGLDGTSVRQVLGIPQAALVIGHVARLTPWKGQHYLLEAFAQVARKTPNVYLLLVGSPLFDNDSYEQTLRRRVSELGLADRVIFAGYRTDLPQVLAAMDLFAYPSVEKDTSPLALLSAMATGLPVVAFDIEGVREVIADAGILTPVKQIEALTQALVPLLADTPLRQQQGHQARLRIENHFSLQRYVAAMERVMEQLGEQEERYGQHSPLVDSLRP